MPDTNETVQVSADRLSHALKIAGELRAMYEALSAFERGLAAKQIAAIQRLVEAVESL
ncbi:hypothetical protein BCEN4_800045 [Burkholderia cenocepacia]|uniref:hypothetical protein n=1 Tax=Burkholderia cenocepacia TaxID=95486 RepID=UPI00192A82C6|nr:hypothetical protein [Burkholderia cenocepacia]CAD9228379.1 hypothetical protein BCEN4_800045 [Burkholderia cenocepacia]